MSSNKLMLIVFLLFNVNLFSQSVENSGQLFRYDFVFVDQPNQFFTIRQNVSNTQSLYRLFSKKSKTDFSSLTNFFVQATTLLTVIIPLEQSGSYRAVLTYNKIASTYQPFSLSNIPEPSIVGVSDKQLSSLKENTNQFIRLYTAGIESNYIWLNKMEENLFFKYEDIQNVKYDYIFRKVLTYSYHLPSLLSGLSSSFTNNGTELEQRITNINIYSYAKNIFNDTIRFNRNVDYSDLTSNEKSYLSRVAYFSFINLVSNFALGIKSIRLNSSTEMAFSLSQLLSPLGEIYNQDFWFRNTNGLKAKVTFREIINDKSIFPGISLALYDLNLSNKIKFDWSANLWSQPEHLSFKDRSGSLGGASEIGLHYQTKPRKASNIKRIDFDLNALYKSQGFLPGILNLDESLILSAGLSISIL